MVAAPIRPEPTTTQIRYNQVDDFQAFRTSRPKRVSFGTSGTEIHWNATNYPPLKKQFMVFATDNIKREFGALVTTFTAERMSSVTTRLNERHTEVVAQLSSPALRRLTKIAALEANWDSEGAESPAALAIARAGLLIQLVNENLASSGKSIHPPDTSAPLHNGGIQLEWWSSALDIETYIEPNGSVRCLFANKLPDGAEDYDETGDLGISDAASEIADRLSAE